MASLARIPFTTADEEVIRTMNGWMLFLVVVHFLGAFFFASCGCLAVFGSITTLAVSPLAGVLMMLQMLLLIGLGVIMGIEGFALVQARSSLNAVVATDTADQRHLSAAFKRLKLFFLLELGWFSLNLVVALVQVASAIVAPEMAAGGFGDLGGGGFGQGGGFGGGGYDPGYGGGTF